MIKSILTKKVVKDFFDELITNDVFKNKIIPNRFNDHKMNPNEYTLYIGLDAVIKYAIIIDDEVLLDKYIEKLMRLLKKVDAHNEIKIGVNKLIVKTLGFKFGITDIDDNENKEKIIKYVYDKYIINGYFYHSFPSTFVEEVKEKGLDSTNYYHALDEMKEIDKILDKYKINRPFSKDLDSKESVSITDSFFMASFYAYNSPLYLKELCTETYKNPSKKYNIDSFFQKDYKTCKLNLEYVLKKYEVNEKDKNTVFNFFNNEWKNLDVNNSLPTVAFIKRKMLNKNNLYNFNNILINSKNVDIFTSVSKILDMRSDNENFFGRIDKNNIFLITLPEIKKHFKENVLFLEEIKDEKTKKEERYDFVNEYGNATFMALFGVLLITLGVTLTIIMLGR